MFRKYEKTKRLQVPQFDVPGKISLDKNELSNLLGAEVIIEEKFDGANTGIIRHKNGFHLQKRGSLVAQSEHAQFQYFHAWAWQQKYEQIMDLPKNYIVYGELLYAVHSIFYDRLPEYWICFEVWNGSRYLDRTEKENFCAKHGFVCVPLLARGFFTPSELGKMIPEKSAYGETCEGIVVKRYRKKKKERMIGKIVRPEFIKQIEENGHWMHQQMRKNLLEVR